MFSNYMPSMYMHVCALFHKHSTPGPSNRLYEYLLAFMHTTLFFSLRCFLFLILPFRRVFRGEYFRLSTLGTLNSL